MKEKPRKIILCLAIIVFVVSLYSLVSIFLSYRQGTNEYDELEDLVFIEETTKEPVIVQTEETEQTEAVESHTEETIEETTTVPVPTEPREAAAVTQVDFAKLREINPEVKGWIYIPGTLVSYPIVQTDNNDYYLNHTFKGTKNGAGAIFLEYLMGEGLNAKNSIMYGHNMLNGSMFGSLKRYMKKPFYDANHKTVLIFTESGVSTYEIFATFTVKEGISDAYTYGFGSDESFAEYISMIKGIADYETNVSVLPTDKIITLSTCTNRGEDRYVVQAKLIQP